ncbi:MAG: response regulator [Acetobacteraceae bacterium]
MSRRARILVVEDEAMVAMLLEDTLNDAGFQVLGPAATVAEAMAVLDAERPAGAVLDINLGGETSAPVADRLAAEGVPFLICSGYGASGVPPAHAARPVLAKPYDPGELLRTMRRLLGG